MQVLVKCILVFVKTMNWFYGRSMIAEFCLKFFSASLGFYCCHPVTLYSSTERKNSLTIPHLFVLFNDAGNCVEYRGMDKNVASVERG
jgi:hypothetical protein